MDSNTFVTPFHPRRWITRMIQIDSNRRSTFMFSSLDFRSFITLWTYSLGAIPIRDLALCIACIIHHQIKFFGTSNISPNRRGRLELGHYRGHEAWTTRIVRRGAGQSNLPLIHRIRNSSSTLFWNSSTVAPLFAILLHPPGRQ